MAILYSSFFKYTFCLQLQILFSIQLRFLYLPGFIFSLLTVGLNKHITKANRIIHYFWIQHHSNSQDMWRILSESLQNPCLSPVYLLKFHDLHFFLTIFFLLGSDSNGPLISVYNILGLLFFFSSAFQNLLHSCHKQVSWIKATMPSSWH